jgi:hypothetical protein
LLRLFSPPGLVAAEIAVDSVKQALPQTTETVFAVGRNEEYAFRFSFILPTDYAIDKP